jgi:SAM-dependent methyltransferase
MNRKQRRAAGRPGAGSASGATAGKAPGALADLLAAAVAQHQAGALAEAERRYRHIVALFPAHAETYSRLGAALMAQGKTGDAIAVLERALAIAPNLFEALGNLAQAHMAAGRAEPALDAISRALAIRETPQGKTLFAHCVKFIRFTADDARCRKLLVRALTEGWARPRTLTAAAISLVRCNAAIRDWIGRANAAWPARLPATELLASPVMTALLHDELLSRVLESDPITDVGLERLLTNVRYAMLTSATADGAGDANLLGFYSALARQCFVNEYVFSLSDAEPELVAQLQAALEAALAAQAPCPPLWPIAVGAYGPLHILANAEALPRRSWPQTVAALIGQQVEEPAEERRIAAAMPVLTAIEDDVSRAVRAQYEANPYPRWAAAAVAQPDALRGKTPENAGDVLIAGCGTGLSTIDFARQAPRTRVLAIDLSLASLSYAKRMAQALALANIEFAQADIMKFGAIGRTFDFIDSSGVLHHLADPWAGWKILLSLLRPGGTMQVGLYSEFARRHVVAARALIAERGYRPVAPDIRRCREEIMAAADGSVLKSLTEADDFYAMSECRDLLFHVQEHRITLPEIKRFLAENGVEFAGFLLDTPILQRFAARFPERAALLDLESWHHFETEAPGTFAGMYQFWLRKP